ncbi:hypothetical protein [Thioalkalivibrio sulfidiphilus]|nr:hypothetical protein [Thioalkalivibrio sulfidiphilus]
MNALNPVSTLVGRILLGVMFLLAGLLYVFAHGAGAWSIDARRGR